MEMVFYPRFEIEDRIRRLQNRMGDLSGALLFHSVEVAYFAGTGQEGLVYIPRDGQATVMVRKSVSRAMQESPLEVRPLGSLKNLRSELHIQPGSVLGLELDVMPFNNYARLSRVLEGCQTVDISETIRGLRSVKSEFEIGLTRQAARIVDAGISCVPDHLTEGMREIELSSWVEKTMRDLGHQGSIRFRRYNHYLPLGHLMAGESAAVPSYVASPTGGRGVSLLQPQGAGFGRIKRNEPILVDFAGVYNGYTADETRIFSLGPLPRHLEEAHAAALAVEETVAGELISGRTGREIFERSEREGARLGYQDHLGGPPGAKCGFVGHGVGLEIDELPVLGPTDHAIEPGMTVAVEPKMIFPGIGVVGIEDTFLTTTCRPIRLTGLPPDIWQV